jgi:integrase/recombinase XerD
MNTELQKRAFIQDQMYKELIRRRYSKHTLKTYMSMLKNFFDYYTKEIATLNRDDILNYLYILSDKAYSGSYQNQAVNALKFLLEKVMGRERMTYYIDRPFKQKRLPTVLSKEEIKGILNQIRNNKHYAMISLIYSAGLRISELLNLKIGDIDSKRMIIHIKQSKGRKDRYATLSGKLLQVLRTYYVQYRPKDYLFEGQVQAGDPDELSRPYSSKSVQNILKRAVHQAGIRKNVTPHTLRHSYATHLYESGVNLRNIQVLLGHTSSKTTEIYTHVSKHQIDKIKSPIDDII